MLPANTISRADVRRDKFLFANSRFLHQEGNPKNPLGNVEMGSVQPVDDSGRVLSIYASDKVASVPRYLVGSSRPVDDRVRLPETSKDALDDYQVKLTGFGGSQKDEELQGFSDDFDFGYRAPELVLDSQLRPSADIWSLACLVCTNVSHLSSDQLTMCKDIRNHLW